MSNEIKNKEPENFKGVSLTGGAFVNYEEHCFAYKMAKMLLETSVVPKRYQGKIADCMVALNMSARMKADPVMVLQNLYMVNGSPGWSAQFVIAIINTSGRFKGPLRFKTEGSGDTLRCTAYATDQYGEVLEGTQITMEMAKKEGWYGKSGSKWQTMPEQMIKYRAASYFGRLYCPDLLMGIYSADEVREIEDAEYAIIDEKPTPATVDQEIRAKANKKSIGFSEAKSAELPESKAHDKAPELAMTEIFDQDELTEAEKAAILEAEAAETEGGPDF